MPVLVAGAMLRPARLQPLRVTARNSALPAFRHGVAPRARQVVCRKRALRVQVRTTGDCGVPRREECGRVLSVAGPPLCRVPQAISSPERTATTPGSSSSNGNGSVSGNGNGGVALMKLGSGPSELSSVGALVAAESDAAGAFGDAGSVIADTDDWSRFKGYSTFKARFQGGWAARRLSFTSRLRP